MPNGIDEIWCVHGNGVCVMVYDTKRKRYVYIPEKKWLAMSAEQKVGRYV